MLEKFIENQKDQYVFWILSEFIETQYFENIDCNIKILKKNDEVIQIENLYIGTPYNNSGIKQLVQKQGRKKGYGIPLFFNSFLELSNLKTIEIFWELKIGNYIILIHKFYELNFIFEEDKNIYYLETKNYDYNYYKDNLEEYISLYDDKHMSFYDSIIYYYLDREEIICKNLKEKQVSLTNEEVYSNCFNFIKKENILKKMCNKEYYLEVYSFTKKLDLIPETFSESNLKVKISKAKKFSKLFNWDKID